MNKVTNQMKNPFHPNCLPFIDVWSNHLGVGGILLLVRFENQTHQKRKAKIALISESGGADFTLYVKLPCVKAYICPLTTHLLCKRRVHS